MSRPGRPLLFVSAYPKEPVYSGATVRIAQLARALEGRFDLWAAYRQSAGLGRDTPRCWAYGRSRWSGLFSPALLGEAPRRLAGLGSGVLVANTVLAGLHGVYLKRRLGWPLWLDTHNVEWRCLRRYGSPAWPLMRAYEAWLLPRCDLITCVSELDAAHLQADFNLGDVRLEAVPNGFDPERFYPGAGAPELPQGPPYRLLFFGVLSYPPNREAVEFLAGQLRPRLPSDFEILVAGTGGEELRRRFPELTFLGFVPDLPELVGSCHAVLAPLFSGGGTRLKIVEAAACGRPVLATALGAEGLDPRPFGPLLTVLDEVDEMVAWLRATPWERPTPSVFTALRRAYAWPELWGDAFERLPELAELSAVDHALEEPFG